MNKNIVKVMLAITAMNALADGKYVPLGNNRSYKSSPIYIPKRQKIKGYKRGKK